MGGPFRAIVGGAKQVMSFAAAQAIQLDNHSDQYGHLVRTDAFVAPGQIGMVILVDGITAEIFEFAKPPNASQAAATAGQICLIRTYDEAAGPGAPPPLAPGVGVLLPIGLDSPQHFHSHSHGSHFHSHAHGTHNHGHSATHSHGMTHNHGISTINGFTTTGGIQGVSGTLATLDHIHNANGFSSFADVTGNFVGSTVAVAPGNTDLASVSTDSTATTPATDTTIENVQHTHP